MVLLSHKAMLLLMLAEAPGYGVELIARGERLAATGLWQGAVYPALRVLAADGLITADVGEQRPAAVGGRPRAWWRITGKGIAMVDDWRTPLGWAWGVVSQ